MLIQKDTKHGIRLVCHRARLRALLIQKDTKPTYSLGITDDCLRALLIQKDTKLARKAVTTVTV